MLRQMGILIAIAAVILVSNLAQAECSVAHTHVGKNPTWRPADWGPPPSGAVDTDPTDDNKLWFFALPPIHPSATPGWPDWTNGRGEAFLALEPVLEAGEPIAKPSDPNKLLHTCRFIWSKTGGYGDPCGIQHLDGWHSAHGPQGAWNLESIDQNTVPVWDIYIKRERISSNLLEDDFFMLLPDDTPVLTMDGDKYRLEKRWLEDENAWGIHEHMGFYFWLDEEDKQVYVVLSAHDEAGLYERSADFTMRFAKTVCDPVVGDLNGDCIVDFADLAAMVNDWLSSGIYRGYGNENDDDHDLHEH
jgi:hypothetical protein